MGEAEEAEEDVHSAKLQKNQQRRSSDGWSGPKFTVLLVEDDNLTCKLVADTLKACSYEVLEAENGRIALDILGSEKGKHVDIVLTDNVMPEVSGIELVDKLVGMNQQQHLPIVVMSTDCHEDVMFKALKAGASDFLAKPLSREKLNSLCKHAISMNGTPKGKFQAGETQRSLHSETRPVEKHSSSHNNFVSTSANSAFHPVPNGKRSADPTPISVEAKRPRLNTGGHAPGIVVGLNGLHESNAHLAGSESVHQAVATDPTKPAFEAHPLSARMLQASWPGWSRALVDFRSAALQAGHPLTLPHESMYASWGQNQPPGTSLEIQPLLRTDKNACNPNLAQGWSIVDSNSHRQDGRVKSIEAPDGSAAQQSLHQKAPGSAFTAVLPRANAGGLNKGLLQYQPPNLLQKQQFFVPHPGLAISRMAMQQQLMLQSLNQAALPQRAPTQSTTAANRRAAIERFRAKRDQRSFGKKVRYTSRQRLAENRPRIRGQFVKASSHDEVDSKDESSTPETATESPGAPN